MSTTETKPVTQADFDRIKSQRDDLARDVIFAVNFLDARGSGLIGNFNTASATWEHWLTRFRRHLKEVGIEWDDDLLEYGRASITNRKKMLKNNPELAKKLAANKRAT